MRSEGKARTVDVNRPDGALMSVIRAQPLAIVGEPDVNDVVFRAGEEEVALEVELDLCERALVACVRVSVSLLDETFFLC